MKLSNLASKPQLVEISLDDEATIKEFGEPVTFYTWDRQPLSIFMSVAIASEGKTTDVFAIVKDLILDEHGDPILTDEVTLPQKILTRAMNRVVSVLGN